MEFQLFQTWQEICKIMISHKYKLIFIHIPRTGGTSIEKAILNNRSGWWGIHAPSKHLNAYSAKKIYKSYWDDYFKFTFVRNPWDRMVSMLKYGSFYGVHLSKDERITIDDYLKYFKKIEYDRRFFNFSQIKDTQTQDGAVYGNIIGEDMNFVGKFETLDQDFETLCELTNIPKVRLPKIEQSLNRKNYKKYYNEENKLLVKEKYRIDIEKYNYIF